VSSLPRYNLTGVQQFFFVLLRIGIGWHFLREGIVKLSHPTWSAIGYLNGSWGPFSGLYHWIGQSELTLNSLPLVNMSLLNFTMLDMSNFFMPWALTLLGLGLMLGLFTRLSILGSIGLLVMFYTAAPPIEAMPPYAAWGVEGFTWAPYMISLTHAQWAGQHMIGCEGNYMLINKNLLEMLALFALLTVNTGLSCGLDVYVRRFFCKGETPTVAKTAESSS